MPRKSPYKLIKVTINMREGDMDRLRELHPRTSAGEVIRLLVAKHIANSEVPVSPMQLDLPI